MLAIPVAITGVLSSARPSAAASISGGGQLNATTTLSQFPCPTPIACTATTSGGFRGLFAGTDVNGKPYTLTFPDPTAIPPPPPPNFTTSGLTFTDNCDPSSATPAIAGTGTGDGTFIISDGLLTRGTTVSHGAVLQGSVHFERDAVNMTMGLSAESVLTSSGGTLVATGQLGTGEVSFTVGAADLTATCNKINFSSSLATIIGKALAVT
jgi:hypothetical protein